MVLASMRQPLRLQGRQEIHEGGAVGRGHRAPALVHDGAVREKLRVKAIGVRRAHASTP
jgi:hypothetical protein